MSLLGGSMKTSKEELEEKKTKLQKLIMSRPKGYCSTVLSTKEDVQRETEIEDLEDEINTLEKKVKETDT